jgi:hypothetical protein
MSKPKPGALFIQAWVSEVSGGVARRPSWIARKLSTRPPTPSVAPPSSTPVPGEARAESTTPGAASPSLAPGSGLADEGAPFVSMPQPPPHGGVDIATSIALAQLAEENAALRTQITEMAAKMANLQREVLESSEEQLVKLALAIAERVVGRELATDPALPVAWARQAIDSLAAKDGVVIAVAKDVRDEVPADAWARVGVDHRVLTDSQLGPAAIEVRTPEGTLATGADARLTAVAQALGIVER